MAAIVQQLQALPIYGGVAGFKYGKARHEQENAGMAQQQSLANQQAVQQAVGQVTGQLFNLAQSQYQYDRRVELENLSHDFAMEMMDGQYRNSTNAALFKELGETHDQIKVSAAQAQLSVPKYIAKRRQELGMQKYMAENGLEFSYAPESTALLESLASEEADIRGQLAGGVIAPEDGENALTDINRRRGAVQKTLRPIGPKQMYVDQQTGEKFELPPVGGVVNTKNGKTLYGNGRGGWSVNQPQEKEPDFVSGFLSNLSSPDPRVQQSAANQLSMFRSQGIKSISSNGIQFADQAKTQGDKIKAATTMTVEESREQANKIKTVFDYVERYSERYAQQNDGALPREDQVREQTRNFMAIYDEAEQVMKGGGRVVNEPYAAGSYGSTAASQPTGQPNTNPKLIIGHVYGDRDGRKARWTGIGWEPVE